MRGHNFSRRLRPSDPQHEKNRILWQGVVDGPSGRTYPRISKMILPNCLPAAIFRKVLVASSPGPRVRERDFLKIMLTNTISPIGKCRS